MNKTSHIFEVEPYTNYSITIDINSNNLKLSFTEDPVFGQISIKNGDTFAIDYYNGNLKTLTIECESSSPTYKIAMVPKNIRIKQIYMNKNLKITFYEDIIKMYDLEEYHDPYAPSLFYGLFDDDDISVLEKNKSMKLIVWVGGDINTHIKRKPNTANILKKFLDRILQVPKIRHVSISSFIRTSLTNLNLPFKMVPFMGIDFDKYKPVSKGPCIYVYTSTGAADYYGENLYVRLMGKYKNIKFIVGCSYISYRRILHNKKLDKYGIKHYQKEELVNNIYSQCFVALRLTDHDGLSATVQELGLMGIKSIHNGCSPSALNYKNFNDICQHINKEMETIGQTDTELAENVKKYLTIDEKFLTTDFHK